MTSAERYEYGIGVPTNFATALMWYERAAYHDRLSTRHHPLLLRGVVMLYAIVLFCSLNIAPMNCDEASAARYEHVPGGNALPVMCFREAQMWVAEQGIEPGAGQYTKVRCSRHEFGHPVG